VAFKPGRSALEDAALNSAARLHVNNKHLKRLPVKGIFFSNCASREDAL
jgi:hypothetical protein